MSPSEAPSQTYVHLTSQRQLESLVPIKLEKLKVQGMTLGVISCLVIYGKVSLPQLRNQGVLSALWALRVDEISRMQVLVWLQKLKLLEQLPVAARFGLVETWAHRFPQSNNRVHLIGQLCQLRLHKSRGEVVNQAKAYLQRRLDPLWQEHREGRDRESG